MMECNGNCESCSIEIKNHFFQNIKKTYEITDTQQFKYNFNDYSKPQSMLLGLTDNCNLSCSYCFVKQKPKEMTYEIAEQSIEWLIENRRTEDTPLTVVFFGGEPLLKYNDIIVPIVKKYKNQISFSITTNGVLLNEDVVDFFYKNGVDILLSFDGLKDIQNLQRCGKTCDSYEQVMNNIPYLLLRFPETTMRMTLTKEAIPYLYDTVLFAESLGFSNITYCPNAFEEWGLEQEQQYEDQLTKIGYHIYKSFFNNHTPSIRVNPLINSYNKVHKSIMDDLKYNNGLFRCGLGTTSCAITPEGDIIPCQEKISNPTVILGNIYDGIDPGKHEEFLKWYIDKMQNDFICDRKCVTTKECLHCISDVCPSRLEDLNFKFSTATCVYNRITLRIANRLAFLCYQNTNPYMSNYFNIYEREDCDN